MTCSVCVCMSVWCMGVCVSLRCVVSVPVWCVCVCVCESLA